MRNLKLLIGTVIVLLFAASCRVKTCQTYSGAWRPKIKNEKKQLTGHEWDHRVSLKNWLSYHGSK